MTRTVLIEAKQRLACSNKNDPIRNYTFKLSQVIGLFQYTLHTNVNLSIE